MKDIWAYVGWFTTDPWDYDGVIQYKGHVAAKSSDEAYRKAQAILYRYQTEVAMNPNTVRTPRLMNWYVKEGTHD